MASQSIGLDTIVLSVPSKDVRIAPDFQWDDVKGSTLNPERNLYLFADTEGTWTRGTAAFLNAPHFKIEALPSGDFPNVVLSFSAAAFSENNSTPLDCERLREIHRCVDSELRARGLEADWMQAKVSRADVCRNMDLAHEVPSYLDLWRTAAFPPNVVPLFEGANSFRLTLSKSKRWQQQWGNYDKGQELQQKAAKGRSRVSVGASHQMRCELRLRGSAVGGALGVKRATLADLLRPRTFEVLPDFYRASASDKLLPMLTEGTTSNQALDDRLSLIDSVFEELASSNSVAVSTSRGFNTVLLVLRGLEGACEYYKCRYFPPGVSYGKAKHRSQQAALSRQKAKLRREWNVLQARSASASVSTATRSELIRELRGGLTS